MTTDPGVVTPARPRALVFDLLGDYVRYDGGEIRLKALVALGEALGVGGPTMRVTVSRMRDEGWLGVRREGRESVYAITPTCLRTLDEGRRRIFRPDPLPWARSWSMVIATAPDNDRPARERLRRDLAWAGFGLLAPATWVSPHHRPDGVHGIGAGLPGVRLELLTMTAPDLAADRSVAARCWDLAALNEDYRRFVEDVQLSLPEHLVGGLTGSAAMAARIGVVRAYRHFPFRDPALPVELQPPGWRGDLARDLFLRVHAGLADRATEYYREVVAAAGGTPPG